MSWDATLIDDRGHQEGWWDYTHNTNDMANSVIHPDDDTGQSWWRILDGMEGKAGAAFLGRIIEGLEADPDRFRAMNPPNGWGNYDGFLGVLREMRDRVPDWPCVWHTSG
jgi:hypothetical protein